MNHYYRKMLRDPEHNRKIREERKERAAQDPAYAARLAAQVAAQDARKRERIAADPERKAHYQAMARQRYANDPDAQAKMQAARDARIKAMTADEYEAWAERIRQSWRKYARKVRSTPEGRQRYRDYMREYLRQQALRGLVSVGDELMKRSLSDD